MRYSERLAVALLPALIFLAVVARADYVSRREYCVNTWTVDDGLPQNNIQAVLQARSGHIWIGTEAGLARFDGKTFRVFNKENTPEITDNDIVSLYEDKSGILWISTYGGGILKLREGRFSSANLEYGLEPRVTGKVLIDSQGVLWLGTKTGLLRLADGQIAHFTTANGLPNDIITYLTEDDRSRIWIGTYGGGVSVRQADGFARYTKADGLAGDTIRCMYFDSRKVLWIGTYGGGLSRYENGRFTSFTKASGLSSDMIRVIFEDSSGRIWVGTNGGGLNVFQDGRFMEFEAGAALPADIIWALAEDREGSLWIGTKGGGLCQVRPSKFMTHTTADGLSHDFVRSVMEDREGRLWIGTNGGLTRIYRGMAVTYRAQDGLASDFVRTVYQDRAGRIWAGTNGGLSRLSDGEWRSLTVADGLGSNLVNVLHEDRKGSLWIGTYGGGLDILESEGSRPSPFLGGLPSKVIFDLHETADGRLWIGTDHGLFCYDGKGLVDYQGRGSFAGDAIMAIHEDAQGALWIGTYGSGLKKLKNGQVTAFSSKGGLFNDSIYCILEDAQDHLWMSCNQGIFRVAKTAFQDGPAGQGAVASFDSYDASDGLKSSECNGMVQPAGWRTHKGHLLFTTVRGVAHIDPERISSNRVPPPVLIEEVTLDGRPADGLTGLVIPSRVKTLGIRFTALSFAAPKRIRFAYKLEGFDRDWIGPADLKSRVVEYADLPPGRYTFRVKACNDAGIWSEEGDALAFVRSARFYQHKLFPFLLAAVLILAGFGIHSYRAVLHKKRSERKYEQSNLSEEEARAIGDRVIRLMEDERIFRNADLSADRLAADLDVPRKHLSQVLNANFGQNFNDFVNAYRIREAQRLILDSRNRHLKLLAIAFEVGFNSKSAFNGAFKKHTGVSPSAFRGRQSGGQPD